MRNSILVCSSNWNFSDTEQIYSIYFHAKRRQQMNKKQQFPGKWNRARGAHRHRPPKPATSKSTQNNWIRSPNTQLEFHLPSSLGAAILTDERPTCVPRTSEPPLRFLRDSQANTVRRCGAHDVNTDIFIEYFELSPICLFGSGCAGRTAAATFIAIAWAAFILWIF